MQPMDSPKDPGVKIHPQAVIRIKGLRLRTYIGIKDEEIRNRQDVLIHAEIRYDACGVADSNQIEQALNYRTITKAIIKHVENERFALLERLTQDVLTLIMSFEAVQEARVEIDKPHALRYTDSVSITLCGTRQHQE